MNEYVENLMLQIAEKNKILKDVDRGKILRAVSTHKISGELDSLLYEFYKSLKYLNYSDLYK